MAPTLEVVRKEETKAMVDLAQEETEEMKATVDLAPEEVKDENKTDAPHKEAKEERPSEVTPTEDIKEKRLEEKPRDDVKEETIAVQIEPKTGISFPVKLEDGKQLNSVGMRKKSVLGLGVKVYGFGIYADNSKLKELLKSKISKAPTKPTKEIFELAINSDLGMMVRLVIVFGGVTMSLIRKNFDEGLGAALKKLNGGKKDEELVSRVMGAADDSIKLTTGSVIEITRLPGFILQTKVKDEIVSTVESELLCRAYFHLYLGDDPFDKEAKERFGVSLLSLF